MIMKINKSIILVCVLTVTIILFVTHICCANPIPPGYNGPPLVVDQPYPLDRFLNVWQYLIFAIVAELTAAFIFFSRQFKKNNKLALGILIANLITYPIFYFTFQYVREEYLPFVIMNFLWISEVMIIFLEAAIIYYINKNELKYIQALIISLILNLVTIVLSLLYIAVLFLSL